MTYDEFVQRCNAVQGRRFRITPKGARGQYRTCLDTAQQWLCNKGLSGTVTDRVRGMVWACNASGGRTLTTKGEPVAGMR